MAVLSSTFVLTFVVLIFCEDGPWVSASVSYGIEPQTACDGEVPGRRGATPPPWDVDISWPPQAGISRVVYEVGTVFMEAT